MSYQTFLLTVQTLLQLLAAAGGSYVLLSWQRQTQRQSQHLHVHGGSFDEVEVEGKDEG